MSAGLHIATGGAGVRDHAACHFRPSFTAADAAPLDAPDYMPAGGMCLPWGIGPAAPLPLMCVREWQEQWR